MKSSLAMFSAAVILGLLPITTRAATTNVTYSDALQFVPPVVTIRVGDIVNWTGSGLHTVDGTGDDPICGGAVLPCSYQFNSAGSFPYHCTVSSHAFFGMTGMVVVVSAPAPPPPTATRLTNILMLANGHIQFTVLTATNQTNIIQASTNAATANWVPLSTNVPAVTNFIFTDTTAPGFPIRFYRVASPN